MFCTQCGKQNSNDTKFCIACGNLLKQPSSPAPVISIEKQEEVKPVEIKQPSKPVTEKREIKVETSKEELVKNNSAFPATPVESSNENLKSKTVQTGTVQPQNIAIASPRKKKTGMVVTIILLLALVAGGTGYWYYNEQQALKYFSREYSGYINNSYVNVSIVRQGYVVSGSIKFNKANMTPVSLKGTVDGEGNFSLSSLDMSASFKGKFVGKTIMTGTANANRNTKAIDFNLISNSK